MPVSVDGADGFMPRHGAPGQSTRGDSSRSRVSLKSAIQRRQNALVCT